MNTGDIKRMFRRDLAALKAYQPIIPPDVLSEQVGVPESQIIKLDGNENPYGCSLLVRRALGNYPHYHIYPDPEQHEVRRALSEYAGVDARHIVAGAGSDELIDLILRLFIEPGDTVVNCPPTFGMYPFCTDICGGRTADIPRDGEFNLDIAAIKAIPDAKVIFIASPNNPTGNLTPPNDILELVKYGRIVVVDEAYYEFSRTTLAGQVPLHENLIVLRSFSKWAGLAGLRLGYGIFPPFIAGQIMKIKQPYNVNLAAQVALLESLADIQCLQDYVGRIISERERLYKQLQGLGFLHPYPSQANFILCRVVEGDARRMHQQLRQRGIFVRHFDTPLLGDALRISVGKPEHTDALIRALQEIHSSR